MKSGKVEQILRKASAQGPLCFTLLDSQKTPTKKLPNIIKTIQACKATAIFVGGSTISDQMEIEAFVNEIKKLTKMPVPIIFATTIAIVSESV